MHGQQNVKTYEIVKVVNNKICYQLRFYVWREFSLARHLNLHMRLSKIVEQLVSQVKVSEI